MESEAYFEDIQEVILKELRSASQSIYVAVAWFTDPDLFDALCARGKAGVSTHLMIADDSINRSSPVDHDLIRNAGGALYRLPASADAPLMHNKFCVIDESTVITGSYNWSRKAQTNYENITVSRGDAGFALRFVDEFHRITALRSPSSGRAEMDIGLVVRRLKLIEQIITLGDLDDVEPQLTRLSKMSLDEQLRQIVRLLQGRLYADAVSLIDEFVTRHQQVTLYLDPEIEALRLEMRVLEVELATMDAERASIEKLLRDFTLRHARELGDLVREILRLRMEKLRAEAERDQEGQNTYEKAQEEYRQYDESYQEAVREPQPATLSPEDQKELKRLYRSAVVLCHPDKVREEDKSAAAALFREVDQAYKSNNIRRLRELLDQLKSGSFSLQSDVVTEKMRMRSIVVQMRTKKASLERVVESFRISDTWKTIASISDWDIWFAESRQKLVSQLNDLRIEINAE
jgi:hypothetical protein